MLEQHLNKGYKSLGTQQESSKKKDDLENLSSDDDQASSVNHIRREITEVCASGKVSLINNTMESGLDI